MAGARSATARDSPLPPSLLGGCSFACGALMHLRVEWVGDVLLGEPVLVVVALVALLARGWGRHADLGLLASFAAAGLCMLTGYALSDLLSGTEPWQYLRGWARVAVLLLTAGALAVVASHGPRNLWWFAVGLGVGGLAKLAVDGTPLDHWKLGYGDAVMLLAVTLGGLARPLAAAAIATGLGLLSIALDYRSLGASAVLVGATLAWQSCLGARVRWGGARHVGPAAAAAAAALVIVLGLQLTETQYEARRLESNLGRHARMEVALQAIADSPLVGYGSWAASERFVRMIRNEEERASAVLKRKVNLGESLMPHSQLLQAWVEGGLLAAAFFLFFAWQLASALWWLVRRRGVGPVTPLYLYLIFCGLWNVAASPFLGIMRVYVAMGIAALTVLALERKRARAAHLGQFASGPSPSRMPRDGHPSAP